MARVHSCVWAAKIAKLGGNVKLWPDIWWNNNCVCVYLESGNLKWEKRESYQMLLLCLLTKVGPRRVSLHSKVSRRGPRYDIDVIDNAQNIAEIERN